MKDKRKAPVPVEKQDMEALYEHLNPVASRALCGVDGTLVPLIQ